MHRGRAKASVLPVHRSSSSKRSSEEPKRIPALAYIAACFAIGVLIGKTLRPETLRAEMAEFRRLRRPPQRWPSTHPRYKRADRRVETQKSWTRASTPSTTPGTRTPRRTASGRTGTTSTSTTGTRPSGRAALRPRPGKTRRRRELLPRAGRLSADDAIIEKHFAQLRKAKIGVAVVSWYPPRQARRERARGRRFGEEAAGRGGTVCLRALPPPGALGGAHGAAQLQDVAYAVRTYGAHEAYHKIDGKCVFFAYDSYQLAARDWRASDRGERRRVPRRAGAGGEARRRLRGGSGRLRRGLLLLWRDGLHAGRRRRAWKGSSHGRRSKGGLFVPCVAPGYDDLRVRPWNDANSRGREAGAYYDRELARGARERRGARRRHVLNGWHEGTQIETAAAAFTPDRPGVTKRLAYPSPALPDEDGGLGGECRGGARRGSGTRIIKVQESCSSCGPCYRHASGN